jgi:hypothetical protein
MMKDLEELLRQLGEGPVPDMNALMEEARRLHRLMVFASEDDKEQVRERYWLGDDLEIDDDALYAEADDGGWVQVWVWVEEDE